MRHFLFVFSFSLLIVNCQRKTNDKNDIQTFFNHLTTFYCVDSIQNEFDLKFKYQTFDSKQMSLKSNVPDSIEFSTFYNAYSDRLIDVLYQRMNLDSTTNWKEIFNAEKSEIVKEKIVYYYSSDSLFRSVFYETLKAFNNQGKNKSVQISIDSLLNISLAYLHIAGYDENTGFAIRFCGVPPFKSCYSNRLNIIISGFCKEALFNQKMLKVINDITNEMKNIVNNEGKVISDRAQIINEYDPIFHEMLKNDGTLRKTLLDYYELRKNIEIFEVIL